MSHDDCPALVLNADFRPLSYFPLSLWSWQEAIKAVFLGRVNIVSEYDRMVRSPNFEMRLPSVISLRDYVPTARRPAFTRFNVFLRDRFACQYCNRPFPTQELTFDHVIPRSRGGDNSWENCVLSCINVNRKKAARTPEEAGLKLLTAPRPPTAVPSTLRISNVQNIPEWQHFLVS